MTNRALTVIYPLDWPEVGKIYPESEEKRCIEPECYTETIKYGASKDQIEVRN